MTEPTIADSVRGINHLTLVCSDMARTVDFYSGVLGFPLIKTVELPGGRGQHFFFDIGLPATLAFFWFPNAPAAAPGIGHQGRITDPGGPVSAIASMNHVAFDVPVDQIEAIRDRLIAAGVECTPVVNHDDSPRGASREMHPGVFVRSVYFRDPDDISLELAAWTKVFDESDVQHAPADRGARTSVTTEAAGAVATSGRDAAATPRLSADDWVRAALDVMVDEGIGGVKIQRLCDRLGVTKGSFYWHFADLDTFLSEVARQWATDGAQLPGSLDGAGSDPEARLLLAMKLFADPRNRGLARAIRDWAQHDERARAAIHEADEAMFEQVKAALAHRGFDDAEAEVRAKILYYSGVGYAHVGTIGRKDSAERQLRRTWEILTQPAG